MCLLNKYINVSVLGTYQMGGISVRKNKFLLTVMAVVLMISLLMSACSSGKKSNDTSSPSGSAEASKETPKTNEKKDKVTITLLAFAQPHEEKLYSALIKKFEQKYPHVKVNYIATPAGDGYQQKLQAMIAGKQTPDVFYAAPERINFLLDTDQLLDMTDYINSTTIFDPNNIWAKGLSKYTRDGRTYALPKDMGPFAYAYNKTLFDAAGIPVPDSKIPLSWDEYIALAKKLTLDKNGNNAESPSFDIKNIKQYGGGFWWTEPAIWGNGADYINEDGTKVTIDDPKFVEALKFVRDLRAIHHVVPSAEDEKAMNSYTRWLNGTTAMFPMGPWDQAAFWDLKFDYDLMPWPTNTGESATWLGSIGFAVSPGTKSPQEAFDLAAFLTVDPDIQREAMTMGLQVPNLIDMAKSEYMNMTDKKPVHKEVFIDVIEKNGRDWPFEKTYDKEWFDLFGSSVSPVWDGQKSPEDFVKEMQPKMQELLNKSIAKQQKSQNKK